MADEKIHIWVTGALVAAVTGIYGFLIKHVINHPSGEEIAKRRQELWEKKQDKTTCDQIVKRIDEHQQSMKESLSAIHRKLDRVLEWQENGGHCEP